MSAHASGVLLAGVEPPPDRMLPSPWVVISDGSASTSIRSACVIWPIFSASVIWLEQVVDPLRSGQAAVLVRRRDLGLVGL